LLDLVACFFVFILSVVSLFCQYHSQVIDWKNSSSVERDVKLCTLTMFTVGAVSRFATDFKSYEFLLYTFTAFTLLLLLLLLLLKMKRLE